MLYIDTAPHHIRYNMCEQPRPEIHRRGVNEVFQRGRIRAMQVRSVDDDAVRQVASEDRGTRAAEELAPRCDHSPSAQRTTSPLMMDSDSRVTEGEVDGCYFCVEVYDDA
jgi:hypothetical protein